VIRVLVETSGEAPELAAAEAVSAAEAMDGRASPATTDTASSGLVSVDLPPVASVATYAGRLALAHRVLVPWDPLVDPLTALREAGHDGQSASVRRLGRPSGSSADPGVLAAGKAFKDGGGRIDLERPDRRFWLLGKGEGALTEEAPVDRRATAQRRMPNLPFQRPVSLPPRLARAAANLARVRPGHTVLDPFLGTGALLAEAGFLGGRLYGIDRDPEMVRGALRNLAHFELHAEELVEGDADEIEFSDRDLRFDGIVTDPPYGRSSGTGGEAAQTVVERVVPRWADRVRSGGRVVVVLPGGYDPLRPPWKETFRAAVRVHRSLTREFRIYERLGG
jgi:putative methyltransferase (TIGR01177 family)